ncbi:hypothetical protein OSB04_016749 [Centaurea solstitialis]|uniref:Uncharacterized protein n=1 Tax=Centaurea solstitialis TaxID=347529 RepID=A0AA38T1K8_9ASTR|nr:hypothetical protein OSB04_016749 [Centaurea solstitialis]
MSFTKKRENLSMFNSLHSLCGNRKSDVGIEEKKAFQLEEFIHQRSKIIHGHSAVNGDIFPRVYFTKVYPTCHEKLLCMLCYWALDDDMEYVDAIEEASLTGSSFYLRSLFATMLISNSLSRLEFVWQKTWQYLSLGFHYYYLLGFELLQYLAEGILYSQARPKGWAKWAAT